MAKNAIVLKNASYKYPRSNMVLRYDEIVLPAGEICLVTGENGCGKTTLFGLCCGVLRSPSAELFINGERANDWSLGKIGRQIGYLFQEPSRQIFCANVWDELTFAGAHRGENHEHLQRKALILLEKFGLKELMRRSTYRLSRGEKQRLAIAAILMNDAKYLLFDEPTTGLDRENRRVLYSLIRELKASGVGLCIVSHDRELLAEFAGEKEIKLGAQEEDL